MDDFLLLVQAAFGADWRIFVQIPHSKNSKHIAEALAYGGLWPLFQGMADSIEVQEIVMKQAPNLHVCYKIKGIQTKSGLINETEIYAQIPRMTDGKEYKAASAMAEMGIGYFLGAYAKKVTVAYNGETIPEAHEGERIVLA